MLVEVVVTSVPVQEEVYLLAPRSKVTDVVDDVCVMVVVVVSWC